VEVFDTETGSIFKEKGEIQELVGRGLLHGDLHRCLLQVVTGAIVDDVVTTNQMEFEERQVGDIQQVLASG